MDLLLDNENEIIIFESKQGAKARENFVLLQLYYPLIFLLNDKQKNIFEKPHNAYSAKHLEKPNPANWIPIYKRDDLLENYLMPVRCGQGKFFYRGEIIFN